MVALSGDVVASAHQRRFSARRTLLAVGVAGTLLLGLALYVAVTVGGA